ncbi:MAG: NUDIX domain-containing protein [Myxococcota bacterium]
MGRGDDEAQAIPRPTARVLALDPDGRLLLMQGLTTSAPGVWFTPGGGVESGESHEDAARREFWEETSHRLRTLGPVVWTRSHAWRASTGRWYRSDERFFVARVPRFDPAFACSDDAEQVSIGEMRWWAISEMASSGETFAPRRLAVLLAPILAGSEPDAPLAVGL